MASNLLKNGYEVAAYDLSGAALEKLQKEGGRACDGPADAAGGADVVVTMLPASAHVTGVYCGDGGVLGAAKPGTLLIDSSTIDPAVSRAIHGEAHARGMDFADAPVSGGVGGAEAGTLTFMVGASESTFVRFVIPIAVIVNNLPSLRPLSRLL